MPGPDTSSNRQTPIVGVAAASSEMPLRQSSSESGSSSSPYSSKHMGHTYQPNPPAQQSIGTPWSALQAGKVTPHPSGQGAPSPGCTSHTEPSMGCHEVTVRFGPHPYLRIDSIGILSHIGPGDSLKRARSRRSMIYHPCWVQVRWAPGVRRLGRPPTQFSVILTYAPGKEDGKGELVSRLGTLNYQDTPHDHTVPKHHGSLPSACAPAARRTWGSRGREEVYQLGFATPTLAPHANPPLSRVDRPKTSRRCHNPINRTKVYFAFSLALL